MLRYRFIYKCNLQKSVTSSTVPGTSSQTTYQYTWKITLRSGLAYVEEQAIPREIEKRRRAKEKVSLLKPGSIVELHITFASDPANPTSTDGGSIGAVAGVHLRTLVNSAAGPF
ncbi:hypothetical protein PoB_003125500 [Plakobranchus ocellatus]|uniref:Uncharacterized protein n=1 Tax=Plakobranchus ocellatus TaxID=259542 RepID=A0AAV4A9A7_9GAST|nr:hypothetical protein PoB_003125500 [Plakobranchus ocellatus]